MSRFKKDQRNLIGVFAYKHFLFQNLSSQILCSPKTAVWTWIKYRSRHFTLFHKYLLLTEFEVQARSARAINRREKTVCLTGSETISLHAERRLGDSSIFFFFAILNSRRNKGLLLFQISFSTGKQNGSIWIMVIKPTFNFSGPHRRIRPLNWPTTARVITERCNNAFSLLWSS